MQPCKGDNAMVGLLLLRILAAMTVSVSDNRK